MKRKILTTADAAKVKALLLHTDLWQHEIAALFGVNQGRVSEIKNGKLFRNVPPCALSEVLG